MADREPGYTQRTVVDCELHAARRLAAHAERLGMRDVAVLADGGLAGTPALERVVEALPAARVSHAAAGEPTLDGVREVAERWSAAGTGGIVAVGGGSTLDTAKVARAFLALEPRELPLPDPLPPLPPFIAVPTTAGTGAELGSGAIVFDPAVADKVLVKHPDLAADVAVCDGALTAGLPPQLTATTGLDALAQAILAYVAAGPASIAGRHALTAIELLVDHLPAAVARGDDLRVRQAVMLGSVESALAMFNAPPTFGAEHVFAEPLGAALHLPHGHTVAALLAPAAELNAAALARPYAELAARVGVANGAGEQDVARAFADWLRELVRDLGVRPLPRPPATELDRAIDRLLAAGAFEGNPVPVGRDDVDALLAGAFDGSFRLGGSRTEITTVKES